MFADSLGLDLELIHTIRIQNTATTAIEPSLAPLRSLNKSGSVLGGKIIVPRFTLRPDRTYEKLITNGICLNSIEIYDQLSIRGVILTLTRVNDVADPMVESSSSFVLAFESQFDTN